MPSIAGMMLIATGLAAALIAAASFAPDPVETRGDSTSVMLPPIVISVFSGPGITASLVSRILAETSAIWRPGGFEIVWRRATRDVLPYTRRTETGAYEPSTLRVVIGDDRGASSDNRTPLGLITFDDEHEPQREIYLSYANAKALMAAARAVVGVMDQMPPTQREVMLGRAMGRALAHELGHYLLAS